MPSTTQRNATDTWTNADRPSRNYAGGATLQVLTAKRWGFLFFNRAAPLGSTVTKGTLRLVYASTVSTARNLTVQRIASRWKVSRTTHDDKPGVTGTTITVAAPAGPSGTVVEVDVTAHLNTVSAGAAWYGWRIASDSAANTVLGSANGGTAYRPSLTVEWSEAPDAPSTLVPSGNQVVSTAKPTLGFDFTDRLGDTALQAVQVQIDAAANWAAPAWDSGTVTTTVPELDLSTTTYPGLASGASTWWRVRVQDGAGLWSEWSDDEQFSYTPLGSLTLDNPGAAPNDFVTEPTPPFLWTPGFVQKAWRVIVYAGASTNTVHQDSSKVMGTATAWTPTKALPSTGPYRVVVHSWDALDRVTVGTASDAASVARTFTVGTDPTVAVVGSLVASQPTQDKPVVRLTFDRATAPDSFTISRDGVVVASDLAPGPLLQTGSTYVYDDPQTAPWRTHTWTVQAVVNGASSDSASVTLRPESRGIWLLDGARAVWLAGSDNGSIGQPEEATVFAPVGSANVVRRVQAQRGYEGSLAGILVDRVGLSADQSEANLRAMRDEPANPVVLAVGDLSIYVVLGNVNVSPTSVGNPPRRVASFEFWQAPA